MESAPKKIVNGKKLGEMYFVQNRAVDGDQKQKERKLSWTSTCEH